MRSLFKITCNNLICPKINIKDLSDYVYVFSPAVDDEDALAGDWMSFAGETHQVDVGFDIDGAEDFKRDCDELVLDYARQETLRSRVWFKSMNFDHSPESLGDIESLLNTK